MSSWSLVNGLFGSPGLTSVEHEFAEALQGTEAVD
jgi:hypothetical protein